MKKLFLFVLSAALLGGCASVQEAENMANCKYALKSVELSDYNVTSLSFDVMIAITNMNKKQAAAIKRFEGELAMNDTPVSKIELKDIRVEPQAVKNAKAHLVVPMSAFGNKLLGLVSMNSGTVDYHLTGTMYFEGPLGTEIPAPVDIGRVGAYNT